MEESKKGRPTSAPANKHMQVITPKQTPQNTAKPVKPKKKGTLAPLKPSLPTASATASGVSFPRPDLDMSEKQKLRLLAGNPMKLDELHASLRVDTQQLDAELKAKEERRQRLQNYITELVSRRTEDGEPFIDLESASRTSGDSFPRSRTTQLSSSDSSSSDDLSELSQSSSLLESIDSAISARAATRERIQAQTDALLQRVDEEGNKLVEMPANQEDVLRMLYSLQSVDRSNVPSNCIEVYEKTKAIIDQNEKNKEGWLKIRELDRIIEAKELELRGIESRQPSVFSANSSTDRPTFVTHYRKPASTKSQSEAVQRNIELAGNPAAKYSMVERLQKKDKDRLLALESEADLLPTKLEDEMQKLSLVDEKLKDFVPKEKWEERSIQSYPTYLHQASDTSFNTTRSQLTAPTILLDAQPGERELQAQKETREARQRLKHINDSLDELHQRPLEPASDFEIRKLLSDAGDTVRDTDAFIAYALTYERDSALVEAKTLLERVEHNLQDDDETEALMQQAEEAWKKYEAICEVQQEAEAQDPCIQAEEDRVRLLTEALDAKNREIEDIMKNLDQLEARTRQQLAEISVEETPAPATNLLEQTIEEFEHLMEKRARARVQLPEQKPLLSAEEFPLTLQLLAAKPEEEDDEEEDEDEAD